MVPMKDSTAVEGVSKEMPRIRRILVPLDGSAYAERALAVASGLARVSHAEVMLLHVEEQQPKGVPSHRWRAIPHVPRNTIHEVSLYLARQEYTLREQGVRAQSRLARGEADGLADVFARTCEQMRIDLLVLATHASDGLASKATSSAQMTAVLRLVSGPVLLVGNTTDNPFACSGGKGIRLLVPLGTQDASEEITWAVALARMCGGCVEFLKFSEESVTASVPANPMLQSWDSVDRPPALLRRREPALAWWADGEKPAWAANVPGKITTELVRRARGSVALIVLSIPTRQNQRPVLAALEVLRQSETPVLLIPTGGPMLQVDSLCECGKSAR